MILRLAPALVVLSLLIYSLPAWASPDFARVPKTVRQAYADGSYVEVVVNSSALQDEVEIEVCAGGAAHSTRLSIRRERLLAAHGVPSFWFWTGYGDSIGRIALEVSCLSTDLAQVEAPDDADADCRLLVELTKHRAFPSIIEIRLPGSSPQREIASNEPSAPVNVGLCDLTMRSSGLRGESIVFPGVLSARSRLTRR
jgi:hypothetical protein